MSFAPTSGGLPAGRSNRQLNFNYRTPNTLAHLTDSTPKQSLQAGAPPQGPLSTHSQPQSSPPPPMAALDRLNAFMESHTQNSQTNAPAPPPAGTTGRMMQPPPRQTAATHQRGISQSTARPAPLATSPSEPMMSDQRMMANGHPVPRFPVSSGPQVEQIPAPTQQRPPQAVRPMSMSQPIHPTPAMPVHQLPPPAQTTGPVEPSAAVVGLAAQVDSVDRRVTELFMGLSGDKGEVQRLTGVVSRLERDMASAVTAITTLKQELAHVSERNGQLERMMRVIKQNNAGALPVAPSPTPPSAPDAVPMDDAAPALDPLSPQRPTVDRSTLKFLKIAAQSPPPRQPEDAAPPPPVVNTQVGAPATAKFDFAARSSAELTVRAGDALHLVTMTGDGWTVAVHLPSLGPDAVLDDGNTGLLPSAYVSCSAADTLVLEDNVLVPPMAVLTNVLGAGVPLSGLTPDIAFPPPPVADEPLVATVKHSFQPTGASQLALFAGQDVLVLDEGGHSGWAVVQSNIGDVGLVPLSFLDVRRPTNPRLAEFMDTLQFMKEGGVVQLFTGKKKARRFIWLGDDGASLLHGDVRDKKAVAKADVIDMAGVQTVEAGVKKERGKILLRGAGAVIAVKPEKSSDSGRWEEGLKLLINMVHN